MKDLAEQLNPLIGFYDPLGLADTSPWGFNEAQTIGWLRQAEIKHGRVSMAAFIGYIVQSNYHFPWAIALDGTPFPSTDLNPAEQWDLLPFAGKLQIILFIGFLEWYSELADDEEKHYVSGGKPGYFTSFESIPHWAPNLYDPLGIYKNMREETKARRLRVEINNGRLAMIGIMGFMCEQSIPGSVPYLTGKIRPYGGQIMAPFQGNVETVMDLIQSS